MATTQPIERSRHKRVLIMDDETSIRRVIGMVRFRAKIGLRNLSYNVSRFTLLTAA